MIKIMIKANHYAVWVPPTSLGVCDVCVCNGGTESMFNEVFQLGPDNRTNRTSIHRAALCSLLKIKHKIQTSRTSSGTSLQNFPPEH